jgi:hypothetical protein
VLLLIGCSDKLPAIPSHAEIGFYYKKLVSLIADSRAIPEHCHKYGNHAASRGLFLSDKHFPVIRV